MFCTLSLRNDPHRHKTKLKPEREQNKQQTLWPWLSAQLCGTQCARHMEESNDCDPLQSTSFPLSWQDSLPPICFLA